MATGRARLFFAQSSPFPTILPAQVDFELPGTEEAKLEAEAARAIQEASLSPFDQKQQQEGSFPQGERREERSSPHVG